MNILINYANDAFKEAQKLNTKTGLGVGKFDRAIEYSPKDIDKKFFEKNKHILTQLRGAGYWLWKPYIILKTLQRRDIKLGDFIFYSDSGSYFINKIDYLTPLCKKYNQDIIFFASHKTPIEKEWTKRDAFILMGLDSNKYKDSSQRSPTFILIKKTNYSLRFFREFLKYAQDERIITDIPSSLGKNDMGFKENRHDQSIFSLLTKKYNLIYFRHPWQIGNNEIGSFKDKYPQILVSTRKSNRSILEKIKYQRACSKSLRDFICRIIVMPYNKIISKNKLNTKTNSR